MSYRSIVTFKPVGRLGNFLFEAASAISYAWKNNIDFSIPETTRDPKWHPVYFPHLRNRRFDSSKPSIVIKERVFCHHARPFEQEWAHGYNIILDGYWQTEKYFKEYRARLISCFNLPWGPLRKTVSVHVRRGDYLTVKKGEMYKHPPISVQWYRRQMRKFPNHIFAFFSDDIQWCKDTFDAYGNTMFDRPMMGFFGDTANVWDGLTEEEKDLVAMSCCEHHICSASTFSWWGAWLNQNPDKRVIMPTHWINPAWTDMDQSDIVPKEWERA